MKANINSTSVSQLMKLYDPAELAILFDWLGIERPDLLLAVDIKPAQDYLDPAIGPIRLIQDMYGDFGSNAASNAVARLVLSGIQDRLPQWALVEADMTVCIARAKTPRRKAKVELLPRFQFEINWADSGPGYSWPEAYHIAYLPGFELYVVTASQDSPEVHGYTDQAIGHFPVSEAMSEGAHRVIVDWWQGQAQECNQDRWAYLFQTGDIDAVTAETWAEEVWDEETGEPC